MGLVRGGWLWSFGYLAGTWRRRVSVRIGAATLSIPRIVGLHCEAVEGVVLKRADSVRGCVDSPAVRCLGDRQDNAGASGECDSLKVAVIALMGILDAMVRRPFRTTLDPVDPAVRAAAKDLAERLGGQTSVEVAVHAMLDDLAHGERVVVLRTQQEVTPAQAADILGVSRQFVDRLCEDGVLAFRRLPSSRHRRIRVQDVVDVAAEREQRRAGGEAVRAALGR